MIVTGFSRRPQENAMSTIRPTDIDSHAIDGATPLAGRAPPARREGASEAAQAPETERVTLSKDASNARLQTGSFEMPVDAKKVEEMRLAVAQGRSPFDPKRVADALLEETLARFAGQKPLQR